MVSEDRVRHADGGWAAVGARARGTEPLSNVPPVIGAGLADIDLLPGVLTDVVDVEACVGGVRVERDSERIPQSPGENFLAGLPRVRASREVAAHAVRPQEGVVGRDSAVARDAKHLPDQGVQVSRRRIGQPAAAVPVVVAAAVANADVEIAIVPELKVAAVVVSARRGDVVEQDILTRRSNDIVVREDEARHAIDAARRSRGRVVEVDEVVGGERRVGSDPEQALLGLRA